MRNKINEKTFRDLGSGFVINKTSFWSRKESGSEEAAKYKK